MRSVSFAVTFIAVLLVATTALAERRMFIISSNADGYGVDRCLTGGEKCGAAVATAYCKSRQYTAAASFRKVDRDDITGSVPTGAGACHGGKCDDFVAIVCTR